MVQNNGKITVQKWSENGAKKYRLQDFTIFFICMSKRQDEQNRYSRPHEMRF